MGGPRDLSPIQIFDGGAVRHLERLVRRDGALRTRTLPARFAALRHPTEGWILFDTGYHPALRDALHGPARAYHRLVPWRAPVSTARALERRGIPPDAVRTVIVSHLHADHMAGLVDFPHATIALTPTALEHPSHLSPMTRFRQGFFLELLPDDLYHRIRWLPEPPPADNLQASVHDLYGDGTVGVIALPGHAAGQIGLLLDLPRAPRTLLVADAVFSLGGLRAGVLPSRLFRAMVFHDDRATRATHDRLRRWWRDAPDLRIVPAHAWESVRAPTATPA